MAMRDLREIGIWATITATAAVSLMVGTNAICGNPSAPVHVAPSRKIADCELSGSVQKTNRANQARVSITAINTKPIARLLEMDIRLVRREFTGSLVSRVMNPKDFKTTEEAVQHVKRSIPASGKAEFDVVLPFSGTESTRTERVSYEVLASHDAAQVRLVSFTPDRLRGK